MAKWILDRWENVCPCCKTRFRDELCFIQADHLGKLPKHCPECGERLEAPSEED